MSKEDTEKFLREQKEQVEKDKKLFLESQLRIKLDMTVGELQPTYEEQLDVAKYVCGFPGDNVEGVNVLKLIELICYLTQLYREKNPDVKPVHIVANAWGKPHTVAMVKLYRQLSVLCELFLTKDAKFSTHGLNTVEEMMEAIKEILNLWLPF